MIGRGSVTSIFSFVIFRYESAPFLIVDESFKPLNSRSRNVRKVIASQGEDEFLGLCNSRENGLPMDFTAIVSSFSVFVSFNKLIQEFI